MSEEIERRKPHHAQPYRAPMPTNWQQARRLHDEEAIAKTRLIVGADMSKIIAKETTEIAKEVQELADLGFPDLARLAVGGYFYKGHHVLEDYMDRP